MDSAPGRWVQLLRRQVKLCAINAIECFKGDFKALGFKKKSNHFFRAYSYGIQYVTFDKAGPLDWYYIDLGIQYADIELEYKVTDALGCTLQADLLDVAREQALIVNRALISTEIAENEFEQLKFALLQMMNKWFEKWSNPHEVEQWIRAEYSTNKDTMVGPQLRTRWELPRVRARPELD